MTRLNLSLAALAFSQVLTARHLAALSRQTRPLRPPACGDCRTRPLAPAGAGRMRVCAFLSTPWHVVEKSYIFTAVAQEPLFNLL